MDDRIKEHLKYLNKYHLLLLKAGKVTYQKFIDDPIYQGSTERFLQLSIESCINIGNRILAIYQFDKPISTPETYADIFREMARIGVFDDEFMQRLIKMAKLRNRLVHLYWAIDPETIYGFLQNNLNDFKVFQDYVVDFLNKNKID
jgi:uncharacterized protein YutE (UPF0331/DUF86 family)